MEKLIELPPDAGFTGMTTWDGWLACECGYKGVDGWRVSQIDENLHTGEAINAWFCPECDGMVCVCSYNCPPDSFGHVC